MAFGNDKTNKLIEMHKDNKYYDEFVDINLNTKNDSHAYLCKRIIKNSTVLDIGCAQGIIGKILKKELNCNVFGIELSKEAIAIAKKTGNYTKLYNFDIIQRKGKDFNTFKNDNIKFDYIIFADVLEHLYDPEEALTFCFDYLNENGKILISLPNIAHYDIIDGLLNDKFNYSTMGLLDNTHIRFFTKYSFAEYIKSIGEKYNKNIDLIHFNSTIARPSFYSDYKSLNKIIKNHKEYLVLQNMFEIIPNSKNIDNLNAILTEPRQNITKDINDALSDYDELKKKYNKLVEKCINIKNENLKLSLQTNTKNIISPRNPIRIIDEFLKFKKNNYNNSILFFIHSWKDLNDKKSTSIGGTALHVIELINELKKTNNCYVITVINNKYMLVVIEKNKEYIYDLGIMVKYNNFNGYDYDFYRIMMSIILNLQIDLIHIHHIINFPCDIALLSEKITTITTIHDYSFICYRYFLLDNKEKTCTDYSYKKCKKCVDYYTPTMYKLRTESIKQLLINSKVVIIPDDSILKKLKLIYNCNNIKVIPHAQNSSFFEPFTKRNNLKITNILNVAFVGIVEGHKGGKIVKDLIDNCPQNINIHLFGIIYDSKYQKSKNNYYYHGTYQKNEIPKLLNDNKIDIVLFLNQCEESFSYTLSEVIYSGIPSLAFNIGAIGNRIEKDKLGWTIDKTDDYKIIITKLKQINSDYTKIKKNVLNYHLNTMKEYISELLKTYNQDQNEKHTKKEIDKQFQYLHNYYLYKKI